MKISNEKAEHLLKLPKKISINDRLLDEIKIDQEFPFNKRFVLLSENEEITFLLEITQSTKHTIRINLHHQDNESRTGLFRVDYNSGHKNPDDLSNSVSHKFHDYVGKYFSNDEHHVHYHVEGYKSLAWAIPLSVDDFEIKSLKQGNDFNKNLANAIQIFAKAIHLETEITINILLS